MSRLESLHEWVHNNFWKYQAITKIPLIVLMIVVLIIIKETTWVILENALKTYPKTVKNET